MGMDQYGYDFTLFFSMSLKFTEISVALLSGEESDIASPCNFTADVSSILLLRLSLIPYSYPNAIVQIDSLPELLDRKQNDLVRWE